MADGRFPSSRRRRAAGWSPSARRAWVEVTRTTRRSRCCYTHTNIATTVSERDKTLVERLGADEIINYRTTDFWKVLHNYDCLYDVFGGKSLDERFKILRRGGRVVSLNATPNARFGKTQRPAFWKTEALRVASLPPRCARGATG